MPVSGTRAALHDTPNLVINGIQVQAENQFSKLTFCTVTACFVKHRFFGISSHFATGPPVSTDSAQKLFR